MPGLSGTSGGPEAAGAAGGTPGAAERVVLYGRAGCHLCDVARAQVRRACDGAGARWREVDVDAPGTDPELRARWSDLVPVVEVDGSLHAHWRVDEAALAAALAQR